MSGYLSSHMPLIEKMAAQGLRDLEIANLLFEKGVRSPYRREYWDKWPWVEIKAIASMIGYHRKKKAKKDKEFIYDHCIGG